MTSGYGVFSYELARYEQVPHDIQEREVAKRKAEAEED
jgi:elongation factor G